MKKISLNITPFIKKALLVSAGLAFALIFLAPLFVLLAGAFEMFTDQGALTFKPGVGAFKAIASKEAGFLPALGRSLLVAVFSTLLGILISIPAGYVISRFKKSTLAAVLIGLFIIRLLPEISIALPLAVIFEQNNISDSIVGLSLAHLIRVLPVSVFLLTIVFLNYKKSIESQAIVDGCRRVGAFIWIGLPICARGIFAAGAFSFLLSWGEFIYAAYLTVSKPTAPVLIMDQLEKDLPLALLSALIITLPVIFLTLIFKKYLKADYFAGTIKD